MKSSGEVHLVESGRAVVQQQCLAHGIIQAHVEKQGVARVLRRGKEEVVVAVDAIGVVEVGVGVVVGDHDHGGYDR